MRPLFAIAPLAAALALLGPSAHGSTGPSWTETAVHWVIEQAQELMD